MSNRRSLGIAPLVSVGLFLVLALSGCKDDKSSSTTCTIGDPSSCSSGLVCEEVVGGEPACFAPVVVRGQVFDGTSKAGIANASVVALDASGASVTLAATTDASGNYSLTVPAQRNPDGTVAAGGVTLRVDASGYLAFPKPPRYALPIDLTTATAMGNDLVIQSAATNVALFVLPVTMPPTTYGTIRGTVPNSAAGALVVAEQGVPAVAVSTAIVGADGTFVLFNVPVGVTTTITAYAAGVHSSTVSTTVTAGTDASVSLTVDANGLANVTGSLNPVNAPEFAATDPTSVILVVESTFNDLAKAGFVPAGLRDGTLTGADTSFSIAGVPPGRYVCLASFENDGLVRDPDLGQGNTSIRHVVVSDTGAISVTPEPLDGIKVTDALAVVSPGATGLEVVTSQPTFRWQRDASAQHYEFRLFDAYGAKVYEDLGVPQPSGSAPVSYTLTAGNFVAPATDLQNGMIYQFRAVSIGPKGPISSTEDMLGTFQYSP